MKNDVPRYSTNLTNHCVFAGNFLIDIIAANTASMGDLGIYKDRFAKGVNKR